MKDYLKILVCVLSLTASSVFAVYNKSAKVPSFLGYVPDEFVVVMKEAGQTYAAAPAFQAAEHTFDVAQVKPQFPRFRRKPSQSPTEQKLSRYYKVRFRTGTLEAAMAAYANHPRVERVEPIGVHTISVIPNDPYYQSTPPGVSYDQWDFWSAYGVDAQAAWDIESGSDQVVVGILDTGVRYFHQDLGGTWPAWAPWGPDDPQAIGNIWINPFEIPANGIDDDGNGYIDDTLGWDFVEANDVPEPCIESDCDTPDNDPDDGNGHGTHIAGTVAAMTNNNSLVAGIAGGWSDGTVHGSGNGVKIMPLRVGYLSGVRGQGVVRMDWAAEAMDYVAAQVERGVNVAAINCSWSSSDSGGLSAAVDNLLAHDVVIVVAAGNDGSDSPDYLNSRADCVAVAATDSSGQGPTWTNHGSWVDVAAPGVDIVSTYRVPFDTDPYAHYLGILSGTSMAAPHVTGIAALLESYDPRLTGPQKVQHIVTNVIGYNDSRDLGSGIANAKLALEAIADANVVWDYATADIAVFGFVGGSYRSTYDSDNVYESLTETWRWPKKNHSRLLRHKWHMPWGLLKKLYSHLEHKWTINVTGGTSVIFYVEAHQSAKRDGDHFVFSYSTDDTSYTEMLTVTKTSDDDSLDGYILPASTRGTVYIRVRNTDRTGNHYKRNTLYIDQMYIESNGAVDANNDGEDEDDETYDEKDSGELPTHS